MLSHQSRVGRALMRVRVCMYECVAGKTSVDWKRGPQPPAAGDVASPEALVGVIEELMNTVSLERVCGLV